MTLIMGSSLPNVQALATNSLQFDLASLQGSPVVLYFYPRDATPGCTTEAQEFRDLMPEFTALNCRIFGISRDSMPSHERFKANQCLPFELISDRDEAICHAFDVIKTKMMYGKEVQGIERSTFLFDAAGTLRQSWHKVKAVGHAAHVLAAVKSLTP